MVSSRQGGTLLFGEWYEAADGLDTTSGGGSGGAGITGGGNGGSGTDALAVELATTGTGGAGGDAGGSRRTYGCMASSHVGDSNIHPLPLRRRSYWRLWVPL